MGRDTLKQQLQHKQATLQISTADEQASSSQGKKKGRRGQLGGGRSGVMSMSMSGLEKETK